MACISYHKAITNKTVEEAFKCQHDSRDNQGFEKIHGMRANGSIAHSGTYLELLAVVPK